ncbi:putative C2H2 finger domain protein [Aspergillus glaucus CBS 516.65]|uniref:C2H2-type domain-containing protein n=1 Tax=Aspergillus glaucus CBS 516.65 TaxID=1160497 RepID=A0A1L9V7X5_ASPGL|nr:hypothetical protein ASPGLDRAFT_39325 [Aspergillus glaucus CBS 516.65]OJJ80028.1 hypothetical protein ASPGLDRAFT_39325 [Aspergillus glaucus CBS 516.65]
MSHIQTDSRRLALSQTALRNMDQFSQPRHAPIGFTNLASLKVEEDDLSSQDNYSLCSSTHANGNPWSLSDAEVEAAAVSKAESPEVQMLSFNFSQQLVPSTVGPSEVMYQPGSDFQVIQDNEMDFSQSRGDFNAYSAFLDFSAFDNDSSVHNGSQSCTDDSLSVGHSSHMDDGQMSANDAWNSMLHRTSLDGLSSIFQTTPVSPPLTEASNDFSITSSCSQSGYPSFMTQDDAMLKDVTATPSLSSHGINLGDPLFPLTPPLNEQDPHRTIRPSKQARRPTLQTTPPQQMKQEEFFHPLPARRGSKDSTDMKNPRDHPYYSLPTHSDGKYYCPFGNGDKPCSHPPTTQKCAYHKYLDSHLKPYRCKVPACMDAQLQFSSNACLFRHEREAHGLHGHGDNPHLCLFEGCDRSVPGYGFPRRWNLYDHMRRVHDYTSSEHPSSPETSPTTSTSSHASKRKENLGRKKRVLGPSGTTTMKRTRSTSQTSAIKAAHQATAHHGQRLQNAERNYYNCRSRLLEEISKIMPQDSGMHEKVNASLQELITLGLNYRHIEASQTAAKLASGLA